jgi:hypothetical protein
MFWSVAILVLGGMSVIFGGLVGLAAVNVRPDALAMLGVIGSLTIFSISALLVWQLARVVSITREADTARQSKGHYPQGEYNAPPQIAAPPAAVSSVTEHTTRNFDPALKQGPAVKDQP